MYQNVPLRTRMPDHAKASAGDVWSLYFSGEDLQRAARSWPLRRYLLLARSPGTRNFLVKGWDLEEGQVDFSVEGECENAFGEKEIFAVPYTAWADELSHGEKVELMKTVRATYSAPRAPMEKIRRTVAKALGATILGN